MLSLSNTAIGWIGTGVMRVAAACWTLDHLAPRILRRNFDPAFFVEHFLKDVGTVLEESKRMNLSFPRLALAHELYQSVAALRHGCLGTHALILALEQLSPVGVGETYR